MTNFRQPYFSASIREFWRRWHISLSTWFRDYVYIPLGGNRVSFSRMLVNLMIVFVVSGLWHGAAWTFVIWGFLHGLYIVIETILGHFKIQLLPKTTPQVVRIALTFILVCFAWIFFRAQSFDQAMLIITRLFDFVTTFQDPIAPYTLAMSYPQAEFYVSFLLIGILLLVDYGEVRSGLDTWLNRLWTPVRWGLYYAGIVAIWITLSFIQIESEFIYFQF